MKKLITRFKKNKFHKKIRKNIKKNLVKLEKKAIQKPFLSLIIILSLLLGVIALNSYLNKPEVEAVLEVQPKIVSIYSVGDSPRIQVSAIVEESSVVTIVAQAGGVVQSVNVTPGQTIYRGKQIVGLSSNYYGGNAATVQRKLAQVQNDNVIDTFDTQKELISKQRNLANLQADNANELRQIATDSIDETETLLELNETILSSIDSSLSTATTSAEVSSLTAQKSQLLAGINQIKSGLRQARYQGSEDEPAYLLATNAKDATLKQLDLQEKSLEMSKEISGLQLKLARVQEATMYPGSPFAGTVERVFVKKGQMVSPGTPLATINANVGSTQIIARVSQNIAERVNVTQPTIVVIDGERVELYPDHVSSVSTDGLQYSIVYSLTDEYRNRLNNNSHISISLPIGSVDTNSIIPFLPLEAIHQSEQESTVFVLENDEVKSIKVELGTVNGRFIEIKSGLSENASVILNRDIIEGQKVVTTN